MLWDFAVWARGGQFTNVDALQALKTLTLPIKRYNRSPQINHSKLAFVLVFFVVINSMFHVAVAKLRGMNRVVVGGLVRRIAGALHRIFCFGTGVATRTILMLKS